MAFSPMMSQERRSEYEFRNSQIRELRSAGTSLQDIAQVFGITESRVSQILGATKMYHHYSGEIYKNGKTLEE
jgi:predicted transcriptional regulator